MNKVILSGNLVRDMEVRSTQDGKMVISNCIAVKRDYKNANGEYDSDFINFVAWEQQAEYLRQYAKKGDRLELVGRWQTRSYQNQYGNNVTVNEVRVESLTVFNKPAPQQEQKQEEKLPTYKKAVEDLPF